MVINKKTLLKALAGIILASAIGISADAAGETEWQYTDIDRLNLFNKLFRTETPFGRIDPDKLGRPNYRERNQALECSGLAVAFNTTSTVIGVKAAFAFQYQTNHTTNNAKQGFDLYVKQDGEWVWAGVAGATDGDCDERTYTIAKGLDPGMKKCIVYFPLGSILTALELATEKGAVVEKAATPFKGRIVVFGSSYTQGAGCSRCGMTYSAQLSRMTGLNFINMGFAGGCKLQPYFAKALVEAEDVDAYLFDTFSNPTAEMIRERLFPFIEIFRKEKPEVPLIFMKTCFTERRMAQGFYAKRDADKMNVADSLMKIAVKRYDNVYYINTTNTIGDYHECTTDGVHPDQHGYTLWAESIRKPVVRIVRKYGLK